VTKAFSVPPLRMWDGCEPCNIRRFLSGKFVADGKWGAAGFLFVPMASSGLMASDNGSSDSADPGGVAPAVVFAIPPSGRDVTGTARGGLSISCRAASCHFRLRGGRFATSSASFLAKAHADLVRLVSLAAPPPPQKGALEPTPGANSTSP